MKPKRLEGEKGLIKYDFNFTQKAKNELWGKIPMIDDDVLTMVRFKNGNAFTIFKWNEWNELAKKHNNRLLKKWVLDDGEREYLRVVLRPFKKDIACVVKYASIGYPREFLAVKMNGKSDWYFPSFPIGTMYQGMQESKEYTLKDLGLYEETLNEGILSDKEKEYLSAVIKPFRDKVKGICKYVDPYSNTLEECEERIVISFENICNDIALPNFMQGTMYTGMKAGKEYTLKELGL